MGGGGFIDTENGDNLMLVYFSNPAVVSGTLRFEEDEFDHNINIYHSVWSWIKLSKVSNNRYILSVYEGDLKNIEFTVLMKSGAEI